MRQFSKHLVMAMLLGGAAGTAHAQSKGAAGAPPAAPAGGQPAAAAEGAPADAPTKVKVEKGAGGKKIYRITDEIRIEGKIQKPEAFFFYQKSSINYDWQELKQDFLPRILDSVNGQPF
jgi:hypothetical protein